MAVQQNKPTRSKRGMRRSHRRRRHRPAAGWVGKLLDSAVHASGLPRRRHS